MAYDKGQDIDEDCLCFSDMLLVGSAHLWWEGIPEDERDTWPQAVCFLALIWKIGQYSGKIVACIGAYL